jgi:hypothetical protein
VEVQFPAQLRPREAPIGEFGEQADLDGREQDLGAPKGEGGLQNGRWIWRSVHVDTGAKKIVENYQSFTEDFRPAICASFLSIHKKSADIDHDPYVARGILACD